MLGSKPAKGYTSGCLPAKAHKANGQTWTVISTLGSETRSLALEFFPCLRKPKRTKRQGNTMNSTQSRPANRSAIPS